MEGPATLSKNPKLEPRDTPGSTNTKNCIQKIVFFVDTKNQSPKYKKSRTLYDVLLWIQNNFRIQNLYSNTKFAQTGYKNIFSLFSLFKMSHRKMKRKT